MFISLLVVTLALALVVAAGTAHAFTKPIDRIPVRIVSSLGGPHAELEP